MVMIQNTKTKASSPSKRPRRLLSTMGGMLVASLVLLTLLRGSNDKDSTTSAVGKLETTAVGSVRRADALTIQETKEVDTTTTTATVAATATTPTETVFYAKPKRRFDRNRFTLDDFVVNGANLARYGFERDHEAQDNANAVDDHHARIQMTKKYQLFDNFEIADNIKGDETWSDLVNYHRDLQRQSLVFYMDKVAQKRYMKYTGYPIPKAFALNYQHELPIDSTAFTGTEKSRQEATAVRSLLPPQASYVVKPTHKPSSSGVWLVRNDPTTHTQTMGYSGKPTEDAFDETTIAQRVVQDLHATAADFESRTLLHAQPGFVVEERYSAWDSDNEATYEFNTFTIWGRVYMAYLKRGSGPYVGLVHRNGTFIDCQNTNTEWKTVPDWLQFDQVVQLAEQLGQNKDMLRVDILVGLPSDEVAGSKSQHDDSSSNNNNKPQLRIAVSETEFHPTSAFKDSEILEEAARLWMAGYKMNIYTKVPNTEVPKAFLEKGFLSEEDAQQLQPIPQAVASNNSPQ